MNLVFSGYDCHIGSQAYLFSRKEDDAMAETMTASVQSEIMTDGQIENACSKLRDALRKHREGITSEAAQSALGTENIGMRMFTPFREQAEMFSEMIVRRVKVNRKRTRQQMLDATGRTPYTDVNVVAEMPQNEDEEVDVYFFPLRRFTSVEDAQKLIKQHGLKPDPYAVAAVNEVDSAFASSRPNGTQWVDSKGRHCYLTCNRWLGGRHYVNVNRRGCDWDDGWWLGGVRASS